MNKEEIAMRRLAVTLAAFALMASVPAWAQYAYAVSMLDGCNRNSGYPDCHPDRHTCTKGEAWQFPRCEGQVLFIRLLRRILPIGSEPK